MDDLIYILLGLVWVGLAFYRNAQKKKLKQSQQQAPEIHEEAEPVEEQKDYSLLSELLTGQRQSTLFQELMQNRAIEVIDDEGEGYEETVPSSFEEEYDEMGYESVEEISAEEIDSKFQSLLEEQETIEVQELDEVEKEPLEFDLRKAVIFSEILDRRYF